MNLYVKILEKNNFSETEKEIANFIAKNSKEFLGMTIHELAANTFTSATTIIRFYKKLGFQGFKDFKIKFTQDFHYYLTRDNYIDVNLPFNGKGSIDNITENMANLTKETIDGCQTLLECDIIREVVEQILQAQDIIAIGVSDTFVRIIDFQNKMLKINKFVKISYFQPDQVFLCAHATENDVAILVSYSGKTAEVINEAKILKQRNVTSIAITSDSKSPLAKLSDFIILLPNEENKQIANYTFASQLAIEYVLNVLYSCIYNANYEKNKNNLILSEKNYLHVS